MKKLLAAILTFTLVFSLFGITSYADGTKIVTIGINNSEEQKQTILELFNISDINEVEVITITHEDEVEVLGDYIPAEQIGTKTYSSTCIEPTKSGGINVTMHNITYVTEETFSNALQTAGIENCNVIVASAIPVSGTGALTGVYKAYSQAGIKLDQEKMDTATQEMIVTSELVDTYGGDISSVLSEVKSELANYEDYSDDELREVIEQTAKDHNVSLSSDDIEKILGIIRQIMALDYDFGAFTTKFNETLGNISDSEAGGFFKKIFSGIGSFFKNIFG